MAQQDDKHSDQSMEEILQSIKRIIADEEDDDATESASDDSDVLELTEMISPEPEQAAKPAFVDDFDSFNAPPLPTNDVFAEEAAASPAMPAAAPTADDFADSLLSDDVAKASSAALHSLLNAAPMESSLPETSASMPFRSGNTVEDLVREALRPMLKDWLEENLTTIVERVVEREARRLSGR